MAASSHVLRAAAACCLIWAALVHAQDDTPGVRKPPEITYPAKSETLYFFPNKPQQVKCEATGEPTPTYSWLKGGQPIQVDGTGYIKYYSSTGVLEFSSFTQREEDEYQCVAKNVFTDSSGQQKTAASMSAPIRILAQITDNFDVLPTKSMSGAEYSYQRMICRGQGLVQVRKKIYSWYDGEQTKQLAANNRRFIDADGTLHFSYLLMSDGDIKTYRCGVTDEENKIVLGSPTSLIVNSGGSNEAVAPYLQYSNSDTQVMLYSDAVLECFFSGYQPMEPYVPVMKWYDENQKEIIPGPGDTKYALSEDKRKLTVKNVQRTDEKNFYCEASNMKMKPMKQPVFLNIISAPLFLPDRQPADITLPEGKNAVFNCDTESLPGEDDPKTPEWYVNANPAGPHLDSNKHKFSNDRKKLTIMNVKKATDIQCVSCKVSNSHGTTWGDGCLNVILPIKVTNSPPLRQEISKGDTIELTITATTDPSQTLSYSWEVNNKTFPVKPPFTYYDPNNFVAYINTSDLDQDTYETIGGIYRRIITNPHDTLVVEIEVVLKGVVTPAPVVSKGGIDMWIIGLILGILFLIIVIIIIIFVICRKKQEGDYNVDKKETGAGLDPEKELKDKGFDDYSRPTYDDYEYPEKKPRGELEYDDVPIGGDDESLAEYGDEADTHFNEDGSFIGVYQNKRNNNVRPMSNESTI